jgi:ribonuclease J
MVSITVYDGATGIGGNKIFVEENGRGVFLDFGKNFGKYGQFYEEFLKSRDTRAMNAGGCFTHRSGMCRGRPDAARY